jgi:DNA transformation protein and related proteins
MSIDASDPVLNLLNIGPRSAEWLEEVGVRTVGDLRDLGAILAYCIIRDRHEEATIHLLYALHGALEGKRWDRLTAEEKISLKTALDNDVSRTMVLRRPTVP